MKENVQHLDNNQLDQVVGGAYIPGALAPYLQNENDRNFFNVTISKSNGSTKGPTLKCSAERLLSVMQTVKTFYDQITFTDADGNKMTMSLDDAIATFR